MSFWLWKKIQIYLCLLCLLCNYFPSQELMNAANILQIRNITEQLRPQLTPCKTLTDFQKSYHPLLKQFYHKHVMPSKQSFIYSKTIVQILARLAHFMTSYFYKNNNFHFIHLYGLCFRSRLQQTLMKILIDWLIDCNAKFL